MKHKQNHQKMEEKPSEVVLFGAWTSPYSSRIRAALQLKGIPYKYVEEDLTNKSELFLLYNPVHKKVPVLVHNGRPIAESLVILEYIDENWSHSPKLLPEDPYQRAKVRFWADYFDQKLMPGRYPIMRSQGEERKKAIENMIGMLKVLEEGIKKDFPEQFPFFNGETLGFLDIVVGANSCSYEAFQEAFGVEIIGPNKNPVFYSWVNALKEHPLMKDTLPSHDKLVARMKYLVLSTKAS